MDRITRNPDRMGGKPCIRGTRVTVSTLVGLVASGHTIEEVAAMYPYIDEEDVKAALSYAAWRSGEAEVELASE